MPYRLVDLAFDERLGRIDDEPLQALIQPHRLLSTKELLHSEGHAPPPGRRALRTNAPAKRTGAGHVRRSNCQEEAPLGRPRRAIATLFDTLRTWRLSRAREDGVPPYIVLTNKQLVTLVKARPRSLSDLDSVDGFGQARVTRYGKDLIRIVGSGVHAAAAADPEEGGGDA